MLTKLSELNPYVTVKTVKSEYDFKEQIKKSDIIIITEILEKEILFEYNRICRENKKGFIYTCSLGLSGFLFVDFGDEHIIYNEIGDEPLTFYIKNISQENEGIVTIDIDKDNSLNNIKTKYVIFKDIKGMTELNNKAPIEITILSNDKFSIGNTSSFNKYISGGIVKETYIPIKKKFSSLKESFLFLLMKK